MYSACLFCHASLGANAAIEHFPVGRRLAFDSLLLPPFVTEFLERYRSQANDVRQSPQKVE